MKPPPNPGATPLITELLLLPDGQILVHNLTPAFAKLLSELNPNDQEMLSRITHHGSQPNESPH